MKSIKYLLMAITLFSSITYAGDLTALNDAISQTDKLLSSTLPIPLSKIDAILDTYREKTKSKIWWNLKDEDRSIIVFFPGLTLNPESYLHTYESSIKKHGVSAISLNYQCNLPFSSDCLAENWLKDVELAVKLAKLTKKEITFAGFSAGGALAVLAASRYPTEVRNLFLIAPALKIDFTYYGLEVARFSCLNKTIGKTRVFQKIKEELGFKDSEINTGCQLNRLNKIQRNFYRSMGPARITTTKAALLDYRNIEAQIYILTSDADDFVSREQIQQLIRNSKGLKSHIKFDKNLTFQYKGEDMNYENTSHMSLGMSLLFSNSEDSIPDVGNILAKWAQEL